MGLSSPPIDKRASQDVLRELQALVPFYASEWRPAEKDAGLALAVIFSNMLETVISRLNGVPEKNFIAFLDRLGTKLLPAQPATVPLAFSLAEGTKEHVLIPARTQVAAGDVVFETEKHMVATPARLIAAYSVDAGKDRIYESPKNVVSGKPTVPFQTKLLYNARAGDKEIFIGSTEGLSSEDVVLIGKTEYGIVSETSGSAVTLLHRLKHDHNAHSHVEKIASFELFEGKDLQEHALYMGHNALFNVKPAHGQSSLVTIAPHLTRIAEKRLELAWSYWGEEVETGEGAWREIDDVSDGTEGFTKTSGEVSLTLAGEVKEAEVRGVKTRWIRCQVTGPLPSSGLASLPEFTSVRITSDTVTLGPDMAFHNDVPLDLEHLSAERPVYPFGTTPRQSDAFYVGSQEAFSKKNAAITVTFTDGGNKAISRAMVNPDQNSTTAPLLSWEYWDGKGWKALSVSSGHTFTFLETGGITFACPDDIQATNVAGQENYWIRVRIIGGDYGKELMYDGTNWVAGQINPPVVTGITIDYVLEPATVEQCLAYNNLEFKDLTDENEDPHKTFRPFLPVDDTHQTLHLGFDGKIEKGPISLFLSIEEQPWAIDALPIIEWEYFSAANKWGALEVVEETRGLTRSGVMEFVFPQDFKATRKFGRDLYWIRAVDRHTSFKPLKRIYAELLPKFDYVFPGEHFLSKRIVENYLIPGVRIYNPHHLSRWAPLLKSLQKVKVPVEVLGSVFMDEYGGVPGTAPPPHIQPCPEVLETFHPQWHHPPEVRNQMVSPVIKGIFLNTTWATHAETIRDEILGSSDGASGQHFSLLRTPVTSEVVWVNEAATILEQERRLILEKGEYEAQEKRDESGRVTDFWVKWKPADDLLSSSRDDRHYEIDRVSGDVIFGDGVYGKIPPIGRDNIRAHYRTGGGSEGNRAAYEVKDLKASIPFLEKAYNPLAADGGADSESLESAAQRGPKVLRHRNRAVTAEDFEQITYQSSRAVARAKCLPNFDNQGQSKPGWVTVIAIPRSGTDRPRLSLQLKRTVESHLRKYAANTVIEEDHLQVSGPVYVEVSVATTLIATSPDLIPAAGNESSARLRAYLHPLSGGDLGNGWDFGKIPCPSDFYALLEKIDGVDHVKSLSLDLRTYAGDTVISEFVMTSEKPVAGTMPPYAIICSGVHTITVNLEKAASGG